jgi:Cytochrome P460
VDEHGFVRSGSFFQVEFMIRDSRKYADTLGWGWARWRGADLKLYGKGADFTGECVGCHTPLSRTDHVFTEPIPIQQWNPSKGNKAVPSANPFQWRVMTSTTNEASSTMSTLYGNNVAVDDARKNSQHHYPASSILSLVTWSQREDDRWFGARIPDLVKTVEFVVISSAQGQRLSYSYSKYEGASLAEVSTQQGPDPDERTAYLLRNEPPSCPRSSAAKVGVCDHSPKLTSAVGRDP